MNALRFVLIGLAALILATLVWRLPKGPRQPAPAPVAQSAPPPDVGGPARIAGAGLSVDAARTSLESALRQAPELSHAFDALRTQFPAIADHTLASAAARLSQTGETTSPDDLLAAATRDLRQTSGVLAAAAGPLALSAMFDTKAAILANLAQGNQRVCADFLYGAVSPEYADFAAGHRALEAQAALASITATAEGRKLRMDRGAPSPSDFKQVEDGLSAKGLSADEIAALLDGKSLDPPLSDDRLCANARTYLDVLKSLPDDARLRIYGLTAELLARS